MRYAIALFLVSSLVFSQKCPEQVYKPIGPDLDPDMIVINPEDGKRLLLQTVYTTVGSTVRVPLTVCDEDGDATLRPTCDQGVVDANSVWTYEPTQIGLTYTTISVKDVRPLTHDEKETRGTIVVVTIPANHAPHVGCGSVSN